jgi:hypothetical protein
MHPEEQAMLDYQAAFETQELSDRMNDIEVNGLYLRNLLNHINDKMVQPAASKMMPAVTLAMSSVGTIATVALGAVFLIMKLR